MTTIQSSPHANQQHEDEHPESPPGGYFVMYGYEKSADHCETLTQARTRGQKLCDEDPIPSPWSIHDADGNFIEDIKRTDGLSLEKTVQKFNQSHF